MAKTSMTEKEFFEKLGYKNFEDLLEQALFSKGAQHARDVMYEEHRDMLATIVDIRKNFGKNPTKFIEEINEFIDFWEECCDCTDGKVLDYKGENDG